MKSALLMILVVSSPCTKPAVKAPAPRSPLANSAPLEIQERCATDAARWFKESGIGKSPNASYASHFNGSLGRCLVVAFDISHSAGESLSFKTLADANENEVVGEYSWSTHKGKVYSEVEPIECRFYAVDGTVTKCKSDAEFEAALSSYLEWKNLYGGQPDPPR